MPARLFEGSLPVDSLIGHLELNSSPLALTSWRDSET
jgi:hypothetical protein